MTGATHRAFLGEFERDEVPDWERQSGVLEVYEASPKPVWTTDAPTHPGVWWIRLPEHAGRVVEVYWQGGRLHYQWSDIDERPVPREGLLWSNRAITEPI